MLKYLQREKLKILREGEARILQNYSQDLIALLDTFSSLQKQQKYNILRNSAGKKILFHRTYSNNILSNLPFGLTFYKWPDVIIIITLLTDNTLKKITQEVLVRCSVIVSDHNVKLTRNFQNLVGQCSMSNCFFPALLEHF